MGYIQHHAIVITGPTDGYQKPELTAERVHHRISQLCPGLVSALVPARINGYSSFCVMPDGSREGWDASNTGDKERARVVQYLRSLAYDDGSTAWSWVLVQYGDDEGVSVVLDHSDAERIEEPPPPHEHSAGCWPGGERDSECDVIRAFDAMREALKFASDLKLDAVTRNQINGALAQADKAVPS